MAESKKTEEKKPDTVKVILPLTRTEKDDVFVSVNNDQYLIKRGEEVEIPRSVYQVLKHSDKAKALAYAYENELQNRSKNKI